MTKILSYAVGFLLLALYIAISLYIERGREIAALEGEKNALMGKTSFLEAEIEKRNEKALDTDKRVRELEEAAARGKNKAGFDWNSNIAADPVIIKLKEQGKNDR